MWFQLIKEEEVDVPVTKIDTDKTPADVASTNEIDINMQDASVVENGVIILTLYLFPLLPSFS